MPGDAVAPVVAPPPDVCAPLVCPPVTTAPPPPPVVVLSPPVVVVDVGWLVNADAVVSAVVADAVTVASRVLETLAVEVER